MTDHVFSTFDSL